MCSLAELLANREDGTEAQAEGIKLGGEEEKDGQCEGTEVTAYH